MNFWKPNYKDGSISSRHYKSAICSNGLVGVVDKTVARNGLELLLKIMVVVVNLLLPHIDTFNVFREPFEDSINLLTWPQYLMARECTMLKTHLGVEDHQNTTFGSLAASRYFIEKIITPLTEVSLRSMCT